MQTASAHAIEKETGSLYADCFNKLHYEQWLSQGKLLADQLSLDADIIKDKICLDAGCGHGSLVYQLHQLQAKHVVGIDLWPCPPVDPFFNVSNVEFKQASLMDLPFTNNSFDVVVSSGVLHHTINPAQGFKEMARVLKPGGLLVLGVYGKHGLFPYCLSLARVLTVIIPIISKKTVEWFINWFKLDPIWRYQILDYLYVPILRRYSPHQVINNFFQTNHIISAHRISNISDSKAQEHNKNKTSYSYDHRRWKNKILFGYGFIVVNGTKENGSQASI